MSKKQRKDHIIGIMGIDQYGQTYHNLGPYPRKALMDRLGRSSASKMYVDGKDGIAIHVGYVIAGLWITLYNIEPWAIKTEIYTSRKEQSSNEQNI